METGGRIPSKRCPSRGSSPSTMGAAAWTTVPSIAATVPIRFSTCIATEPRAGVAHPPGLRLDPERPVRVSHDLGDLRVVEGLEHDGPQLPPELLEEARLLLRVEERHGRLVSRRWIG